MNRYERLLPVVSEKACPRCKELLYWSQHEELPTVDFDTKTGHIRSVEIMRFCPNCGYREAGFVTIDKDPLWTPIEAVI